MFLWNGQKASVSVLGGVNCISQHDEDRSVSDNTKWIMLRDYSFDAALPKEALPDSCTMVKVCGKLEDGTMERWYVHTLEGQNQ